MNFLRWIFLVTLISFSWVANAGDCEIEKSQSFFDSKQIKRKGIRVAELFKNLEGSKVRIKNTDAMRFDANYVADDKKPVDLPVSDIKKHVDRAHAVLNQIRQNQAFTTALNGKEIKLPIGIKKQVGNKEIIICLDSIIFTPTYGYAVMYAIVEDTKSNKSLAFWGKDIRFTKDGGFTGDGRLELLETYNLDLGDENIVSFLVDKTHSNYLVFDCDGFKRLHVDAKIFFSNEVFILEKADGTLDETKPVTADFTTDLQNGFDDWMVQIANVPKFQVRGLEGFSFQLGSLTLDYSSLENPNFTFPSFYTSPILTPATYKLWEGIVINQLSITFPEEFKLKSKTSQRISLTVPSAVIDRMGFTGKAEVHNLIPLTEGTMSDWNYSLDYFSVDIKNNTPVGAAFKGNIIMPVTKSTEYFVYEASIQPKGNYNFAVTLKSTAEFPLWGAGNVVIKPDSWIKVSVANKKFVPMASLTGQMDISASINGKAGDNNTSNSNNSLKLVSISFQKLLVKTTAPYLSLDPNGGAVSFGSEKLKQKMANLPVTLESIGVVTQNNGNHTGIRFTLRVNLAGEKESGGGFSGAATVTVFGEYANSKWSYYKTELNRVELKNVKIAVLTLDGFIEFYREDPVYGSGFSGALKIQIDLKAATIGVDARAIFGKKEMASEPDGIYRYFAVDIMAEVPSIPLFPGMVYLNAIGGGASNRMRMDNNVQNALYKSLSGITYVPDNNKGLGLKALIGIQGQTKKVYEGQLIFELLFNPNGGLSMVAFSGYVQIASVGNVGALTRLKSSMGGFLSKVKTTSGSQYDQPAPTGQQVNEEITRMAEGGAILAQWKMIYDRDNSTFSTILDVFVDVADVIKGVRAYGHAGRIDIYFSPKEWHICVGTPTTVLGVNVINFLEITGYFMLGKNLPTPQAMPNGKRAAFPTVPVNGMGLGARLGIDLKGGGAFWYKVEVKAGFDILIWDVSNQYCNGKKKGVKGWYGSGQAFLYGYVGAGLTECVNIPYPCCTCSKKCALPWKWSCSVCHTKACVDLSGSLTLDIYAIIEAANPTYVEASVSLLSGKINVPIKVGKRCN